MAKEGSELFGIGILDLYFGADWFANRYVKCLATLAEYLGRKSERAGRPACMAEEVAPPTVAVVKIYGYHGHFGACYDLEYR